MHIRDRLAIAIREDFNKNGVNLDGIAAMAHRVTMLLIDGNAKIHKESARRGKKLTKIQTLVHKKPFEQRTAIEQRILDIIFENV